MQLMLPGSVLAAAKAAMIHIALTNSPANVTGN